MLILLLIGYGFLLWFGMYLIQRDARNLKLLAAGLGLLVYASGLGAASLAALSQTTQVNYAFGIIQYAAIVVSFIVFAVLIIGKREASSAKGAEGRLRQLLLLGGFAVYVIGLLLGPPAFLSICLRLTAGILLALLAALVAIREIKAQGESWLPDFFRSLDYTVFFTLLFTGQVALVIGWGTGLNFTMLVLLLISIAVSIATQVFLSSLRALLDTIAFVSFPRLREERTRLRLVEHVQVRIDEEAVSEEMKEEDLFRYMRRALGHFGDLQRLAASPLTQMPWVNQRVKERGGTDEVLERANELKSALMECIVQLKPRGDEAFGTTDEWKYYNALYFPYVIGIKPYSLRYSDEHLDPVSKEALDWFRTYVPERTLYNWQNAAARLVAMSLKEKYAFPAQNDAISAKVAPFGSEKHGVGS